MGMERQGDEDEAHRGSKAERSRGGGAWHRDLARRLLDAGSSDCRLEPCGRRGGDVRWRRRGSGAAT